MHSDLDFKCDKLVGPFSFFCKRPCKLNLLCVWSVSFPQFPLQMMCRKKKKKKTWIHCVAQTCFSAPMKRLMLCDSIRKHFPMGHQWQYTQMRRVHLLGLHSQSAHLQADHSSGSSSRDSALMCMHLCHIIQLALQTDPHLAFKFPDQPGSHALMTRLLLQLNSYSN